MQRITLFLLFMWAIYGSAQVRNYTFSQSNDSYVEIPDAGSTVLGSVSNDNEYFVDPTNTSTAYGNGFPIGFDFVFNGTTYNQFGVSANGWIGLGSTNFSSKKVDLTVYALANTPLSVTTSDVTDALCSRIAALANDIQAQANSSLLYKVVGSFPNRVLIVQWKGYKKNLNGTGDSFSFQIRLAETTNVVQIVYGNFTSNSSAINVQVGLRAEPATALTNFNERTSAVSWSTSAAGATTADSMTLSNSSLPSSGLTYSWTPNACGAVKTLSVTNIAANTATLNWDNYTPAPTGYEYTYSKSSTLPLGSGTPTTANTANISGLDPNSTYNVFFRTKCNNQYTPWFLTTTFKTKCADQSAFFETFDFYPSNGASNPLMPDCWDKVIIGSPAYVYIDNASSGGPVGAYSSPNRLSVSANFGTDKTAYAILPSISNLHDNTNRLRFKAVAKYVNQTLTLGYLTSGTDVSTFYSLTTFSPPSTATDTYQEYTYEPGALPTGITRLAFMVGGIPKPAADPSVVVYLDDVTWEPKPKCSDISNIQASGIIPNSATISWTSPGTITKWQYVYSAVTSEINPYNLSPINVTGASPTTTISNLQPGTNYRVWIRSACNTADSGAWIGPVSFTTLCPLEDVIFENFDASTDLPSCWKKVGTAGTVSINTNYPPFAPSFRNTLKLSGAGSGAVVSLKPLSNAASGTNRLKFMARTSAANSTLELGYLTDINDATTFHKIQDVVVTSTNSYEQKQYFLATAPQSNYLAFRALSNDFYIDDVIWEPNPSGCVDINSISTISVNSTSASLNWIVGGSESSWQYVLGSISDINPYNLTAKNFSSTNKLSTSVTGTITGLTANTTYKVWIKSVCGANSGAYVGPYIIKTSCAAVTDFSENFDSSTALPSCWSVSGYSGNIYVTGSEKTSLSTPPNVIALGAYKDNPSVVAMPAVSNSADATHRLTFKYSSSEDNVPLEVGYLTNISDNSTFVPLGNVFNCMPSVQFGIADLGLEPASQILAFRAKGDKGTVYLDDVVWSTIPACTDISNLTINSVTDSSIGFSWTKGGQETQWQYVVGTASASNPDSLTPFDVTSGQPNATANQLVTNQPLQPNTTYKIWVRSKCSSNSFGSYGAPVLATTACSAVSSFYEDFNTGSLPSCWRKIGPGGIVNVHNPNGTDFSDKRLYIEYSNAQPIIALPAVTLNSFADHILKFKLTGNAPLEVGYLANVTDPTSFVLVKSYTPSSSTVADIIMVNFGNSPVSNVIALRVTTGGGYCFIDNVSWNTIPTSLPGCTQATSSPSNSCGNPEIVLTWPAANGADGYLLDVGTQPGNYNLIFGKNLADALTTSFNANAGVTFYYKIRPVNYLGSPTCSEQTLTVTNNNCYCTSSSYQVDGFGLVNAEVGDTNFTVSYPPYNKVPYKDFTDKTVNIVTGTQTNLQLSFFTQNAHNYSVWIDLNDDFNFDEQTEKFVSGNSNPCTTDLFLVNTTFTIPANAKLGKHRMRIAGRAGLEIINPCYSGSLGETIDFTVNVVSSLPTPPSNDEPLGAVPLTVGTSFATNAVNGTNVNATGSYNIEAPMCGNYFNADVWYKAVVPTSGKLIFEVNGVAGGLTNVSGAVYTGTPDNLKFQDCVGTYDNNAEYYTKAIVSGRSFGETVYFRVWENGGDSFGAFKISAYDSTVLGTNDFDMENFSCYPNPVKDILNLSLNTEISTVTITNLLGQTVISKSVNANKGTVDMSGLTTGSYLVRVTAGDQLKTMKIIKE